MGAQHGSAWGHVQWGHVSRAAKGMMHQTLPAGDSVSVKDASSGHSAPPARERPPGGHVSTPDGVEQGAPATWPTERTVSPSAQGGPEAVGAVPCALPLPPEPPQRPASPRILVMGQREATGPSFQHFPLRPLSLRLGTLQQPPTRARPDPSARPSLLSGGGTTVSIGALAFRASCRGGGGGRGG